MKIHSSVFWMKFCTHNYQPLYFLLLLSHFQFYKKKLFSLPTVSRNVIFTSMKVNLIWKRGGDWEEGEGIERHGLIYSTPLFFMRLSFLSYFLGSQTSGKEREMNISRKARELIKHGIITSLP